MLINLGRTVTYALMENNNKLIPLITFLLSRRPLHNCQHCNQSNLRVNLGGGSNKSYDLMHKDL